MIVHINRNLTRQNYGFVVLVLIACVLGQSVIHAQFNPNSATSSNLQRSTVSPVPAINPYLQPPMPIGPAPYPVYQGENRYNYGYRSMSVYPGSAFETHPDSSFFGPAVGQYPGYPASGQMQSQWVDRAAFASPNPIRELPPQQWSSVSPYQHSPSYGLLQPMPIEEANIFIC